MTFILAKQEYITNRPTYIPIDIAPHHSPEDAMLAAKQYFRSNGLEVLGIHYDDTTQSGEFMVWADGEVECYAVMKGDTP